MMMPKEKKFFISRDCDGVALWSLHNPVKSEYGHWAWGFVEMDGRVSFIRQMKLDEITFIMNRYMVWGDKITGQPWAKVVGYEGGTSLGVMPISCRFDSGIGV